MTNQTGGMACERRRNGGRRLRLNGALAALLVLGTARAAFAVCGDGVLDPGEQCDDHNTVAGDCCSPTCQIERMR